MSIYKQNPMKYPMKYPMLKKPVYTKTYRRYLYGAYGSNLNETQMQLRCPLAKKVGVVSLPDHELVFRGVADMGAKQGSKIMLGIWQITDQCEAALDRYEGFPHLYDKKFFDVNQDNFNAIYDRDIDVIDTQLMIYQMCDQSVTYRPDQRYLQSIVNGYADFAIPKDTIEVALKDSYLNEDPNTDWRFV